MQRALAFEEGRWNLKDVLKSNTGPQYEAVLKELDRDTKEFESFRNRLSGSATQDLREHLHLYEKINETIARLYSYSIMRFSEDTRNQDSKAFVDKAEELRAEVDNRTLFFRLWWIGLSDEVAERLTPSELDFGHYLKLLRRRKPHTLAEQVEQVINLKNTTGVAGWVHHYEQLTGNFAYVLEKNGRKVRDEHGRVRSFVTGDLVRLFSSPDSRLREASYKALLEKYASNGGTLGEIYRTIVRDWKNENVKLRHFTNPISARNIENDVGGEVVEALLSVCRRNAGVFQDFFRLKAKFLRMKRMRRAHIYAPLSTKDRKYRFADAVATVLSAFDSFDPKFSELAKRVFKERHVDSQIRKGKQNGAFCMSVIPKVTPYVLLNFAGSTRDLYTIAHESGHAVHDRLASDHSYLTFQAPLVLAETASVFSEMLLFDRFINEEKESDVQRGVLVDKLSEMYGTIGRQSFFVLFEKVAHDEVAGGATTDKLCSIYLSNLKEQFGEAVSVPEEFKWEWTYIPHLYHTPFYCYAYAFGNLLTLSLFDIYRKEGKSFIPSYFRILSYGGSASPVDILSEAGVDIGSEEFWESGFNVLRGMVRQLRET